MRPNYVLCMIFGSSKELFRLSLNFAIRVKRMVGRRWNTGLYKKKLWKEIENLTKTLWIQLAKISKFLFQSKPFSTIQLLQTCTYQISYWFNCIKVHIEIFLFFLFVFVDLFIPFAIIVIVLNILFTCRDLGNSNITGTLGPELGRLTSLQYL